MLADDVRVELVNKTQLRGREATNYFTNYAGMSDWHFVASEVDGLPAALVFDPGDPSRGIYFYRVRVGGRADWVDSRLSLCTVCGGGTQGDTIGVNRYASLQWMVMVQGGLGS
jgi:hypothetical protein